MSERNDGGAAFPTSTPGRHGTRVIHHGMSMRDWFAGQALAGFLAHGFSFASAGEGRANLHCDQAATTAYRVADFMLAERSK